MKKKLPHVEVKLRGAAAWTKRGRRQIAQWLRKKAKDLECSKEVDQYAPVFSYRYES